MKWAAILSLLLSSLLTGTAFASEGTSELNLKDYTPSASSDIHARIVPQMGMSSMSLTKDNGGTAGSGFSGGLTTELGSTKQRLMETGVLLIQTNGAVNMGPKGSAEHVSTSQIAIPLMAKVRFVHLKSQSWYAKLGAMTNFQTSTSNAAIQGERAFDVVTAAGIGARVPYSRQVDLILEATYNHSAMNGFQGGLEGFLFFTGLSIGI